MKNKILKAITAVAAVIFFVGALSMDSNSYLQYIFCAVSLLWIGLFVYANKDYLEKRYGRGDKSMFTTIDAVNLLCEFKKNGLDISEDLNRMYARYGKEVFLEVIRLSGNDWLLEGEV